MAKWLSILFVALSFITGNAKAASTNNIGIGVFEFATNAQNIGSFVNFGKLDLRLTDIDGLNPATVFDDLTIVNVGQSFVATPGDAGFAEASDYLTNGVVDKIQVVQSTNLRISVAEGTEPDLLFGDPGGANGIDFAGLSIESIELVITSLNILNGFDPLRGPFSEVFIGGTVDIQAIPVPPALWLFGSGLLGLVGMARRKRSV